MFVTFTQEELEDLRRYDAEIDTSPMSYKDFLISQFVDDLLFPDRKRERERSHQDYERYREWYAAYGREYRPHTRRKKRSGSGHGIRPIGSG